MLVFVCSPLRAETYAGMQHNISNAGRYCEFVVNVGCTPFAPHVFFTRFLDDRNEKHRQAGIDGGIEFLKLCNELWVFGNKITSGMEHEIKLAIELSIPVWYIGDPKPEGEHGYAKLLEEQAKEKGLLRSNNPSPKTDGCDRNE